MIPGGGLLKAVLVSRLSLSFYTLVRLRSSRVGPDGGGTPLSPAAAGDQGLRSPGPAARLGVAHIPKGNRAVGAGLRPAKAYPTLISFPKANEYNTFSRIGTPRYSSSIARYNSNCSPYRRANSSIDPARSVL